MELPKKNSVDNNKYNYQSKLPVLYLHHRNTNITTRRVSIIIVTA